MTKQKQDVISSDQRFVRVAEAFASDRNVSHGGKGFGSGALKADGKIFAMISSKGEFVVKLEKERVNEMVNAGKGSRFHPSRRQANEGVARRQQRGFSLGRDRKRSLCIRQAGMRPALI